MDNLPTYSPPGTYLGGQSFFLPDVQFGGPGDMKPGAASRRSAYAHYQIGTVYVVPFVFDPNDSKRLRVFVPPQENEQYWMCGGELEAGERLGDAAVYLLGEQTGVSVSSDQRQHFLPLGMPWELQRYVSIREEWVPRHELARVVGYAVAEDDMPQFQIVGTDHDPSDYWVDVLSSEGVNRAKDGFDPALRDIVTKLVVCVLDFHKIPHK